MKRSTEKNQIQGLDYLVWVNCPKRSPPPPPHPNPLKVGILPYGHTQTDQ